MKVLIITILLLINYYTYSQNHRLTVIDNQTKEIIPFVNVKYIGVESGTYADENGDIAIESNIDSIAISCLGYKTLKIKVDNNSQKVYLEQNLIELNEIDLPSNKNILTIDKHKNKNFIGFSSIINSNYFAKRFDFKTNVLLKKVFFNIKDNQSNKFVLFKIFDIDENGKPSKNILNKHIYHDIKPNDLEVVIDLDEFYIMLENKSYFIVLEIFNMKKENNKSTFKIGTYKSKKVGYSFFKPVYENTVWSTIKTQNVNEEYIFNLYLDLQVFR